MPILTDQLASSLSSTGKEHHIWDDKVPGLCIRVRSGGHKSWVVFGRVRNNRLQRKITLGKVGAFSVKEARRLAQKLLGQFAGGEDPSEEMRRRQDATLGVVFKQFKTLHLLRQSLAYARAREGLFNTYIIPKLGNTPIAAVTRADIRAITDRVKSKHPVAATNIHRAMSSLLSWAQDREFVANHVLRGASASQEQEVWVYDEDNPHLALRIRPTGGKSYYFVDEGRREWLGNPPYEFFAFILPQIAPATS